MTINLISVDKIKSLLGIADSVTTYDDALTALIPIVSADVRRMLNNQFDIYVSATFTAGSNKISLPALAPFYTSATQPSFLIGTVLYHPNIGDEVYIAGYDVKNALVTLSANAIGSGDYVYPTINISQQPAIAKMVWYRYSKQNTKSASERLVSSESFSGVSVTYSDREINKRWGYPQMLIDDLGIPVARIG